MNTLESWIDALAGTLVHSLWQGLVVALLLAGLLAICPRSRPEWRCRIATLALVALGGWMLLTFFQAFPQEADRAGFATLLPLAGVAENALANGLESAEVGRYNRWTGRVRPCSEATSRSWLKLR